MEEKQLAFFESDSDGLPSADRKSDKEYYEIKTAAERFRRMKIDNDLKAGTIVYEDEVEAAWRQNCEIVQSFFKAFTEVVPFEAFGKSLDESRAIHIAAVEDCRRKMAKALENYIQGKGIANA